MLALEQPTDEDAKRLDEADRSVQQGHLVTVLKIAIAGAA
jgi:hypothetical protein